MKIRLSAMLLGTLLLFGCREDTPSESAEQRDPENETGSPQAETVSDGAEVRLNSGAAYFNRLTTDRFMWSEDETYSADTDTLLIDLRDRDAYSSGTVPGAVAGSPADIGDHLAELREVEQVLFISENGQVASQVMAATRTVGVNSFLLAGGTNAFLGEFEPGEQLLSDELESVHPANTANEEERIMDDAVSDHLQGPIETGVSRISPETLDQALDTYMIIDTRSKADFEEAHIPSAHSVPTTELAREIRTLPNDRPLLVYCYSGQTGAQVATVLAIAGFETYTLKNGMGNWVEQGFETAQPESDPVIK